MFGSFEKRLRKELPRWIERGWIDASHQEAILSDAADDSGSNRYAIYALSILGVVLLGTGVITFFAANWQEMAKFTKLCVLFSSMWAAFFAAYYFTPPAEGETSTGRFTSANLAQALTLLACILYGSNIMLIAQIYHIDSHFPNGILVWALGAGLAGYMLRSQPTMVLALLLATLWTGFENGEFRYSLHWQFLLVVALLLPTVFAHRWRVAIHVVCLAVIAWCYLSFFVVARSNWHDLSPIFLMQEYILSFALVYLAALATSHSQEAIWWAKPVALYSLVAVLAPYYILTFPDLHKVFSEGKPPASSLWTIIAIVLTIANAGLAMYYRDRLQQLKITAPLPALAIAASTAIFLIMNFMMVDTGGLSAIAMNLLYFTFLIWLVYFGYSNESQATVNMAFVFFAVAVLTRYFDTFWTLLNRSFFFMGGGLLLIVGGYYLEKSRRHLIGQIDEDDN